MTKLTGVCVGAGYFSQFHYDGWSRIPSVSITAVCDQDRGRAEAAARRWNIPSVYIDYRAMLESERPDFVDIITPPATHSFLCREAFARRTAVICQKPLAPDIAEAEAIVQAAEEAQVPFMVHENFRFQPWHREIKKLMKEQVIGDRLHSLTLRCRMGDGWGEDAYLNRQPYFREMPRLLVYETGVHFIDVFRYLAGEIEEVYARLRTLNPVIRGEDEALILFRFANGASGLCDANRYNESNYSNPRYTFGEFWVEGNEGSLRLYPDGKLTVQRLGQPEEVHPYAHEDRGFAGDSCYTTQQHFVDGLINQRSFETRGEEYLKTLRVQEAVYRSARQRVPIYLSRGPVGGNKI